MNGERSISKMLEGKGQVGLVELAGLLLPPIRVNKKGSDPLKRITATRRAARSRRLSLE